MYHNTHTSAGQNAEQSVVRCPLLVVRRLRHFRPRATDHGPRTAPVRCGISLTEVLIAMGILTVGLLGVASVFPVASAFMQKGDVADRGSAIAQAAFNDALARGVFDPRNWYAMTPGTAELTGDGPPRTFTRNVPASIDAAKALWPTTAFCQRIGQVYVIDPLGAAAMSNESSPNAYDLAARGVPASASVINIKADYYSPAWDQWLAPTQATFPLRRVTFRTPRIGAAPVPFGLPLYSRFQFSQPLSADAAYARFTSSDDLAMDMPAQAGRPSVQRMEVANDTALARQSRGDYSWLATVVPRDPWSLANAAAEVSVVVFYKRQLFNSTESKTQDDMMQAAGTERMVRASVVSTGLSGGELLLLPVNDGITESPFRSLKVGQWLMVCGPSPLSSANSPRFVARWYRVLAIERDGANAQVALRGPQWPWQPQTGNNALSNNLCVAIFPGAVAVHSKTIKLGEESSWSIQ